MHTFQLRRKLRSSQKLLIIYVRIKRPRRPNNSQGIWKEHPLVACVPKGSLVRESRWDEASKLPRHFPDFVIWCIFMAKHNLESSLTPFIHSPQKTPKVFIFPSLTELPIEIGKGFDWRNFIELKTLERGPRWKERRPHVFSKWPQYKASGAKLHGNPTWLKRQKLPHFLGLFPLFF